MQHTEHTHVHKWHTHKCNARSQPVGHGLSLSNCNSRGCSYVTAGPASEDKALPGIVLITDIFGLKYKQVHLEEGGGHGGVIMSMSMNGGQCASTC